MVAPNDSINFTIKAIDALPIPFEKGKKYSYKDTKESGLRIVVTPTGKKTFQLYKKFQGSPVRVKLGDYPDMSIEKARKKAHQVKGDLADGVNPNEEKRKVRNETKVGQFIDVYIEKHCKPHNKGWQEDERRLKRFLEPMLNKRLSAVTKEDINSLHKQVGKQVGQTQANRVVANIKSMFNRAIEWGWQGENPARFVKKFPEKSRDRFIKPNEFPAFFKSLDEELNVVARDYIYMSIYTGARRANVLAMRWEDINFHTKEWRIPETKNGESLTLPLIPEAVKILKQIEKEQLSGLGWVFPSPKDNKKHLNDPKKAWQRILKRANIKDLRIHDLRRTMGSYQAAAGSSLHIIGKSLGHKSFSATQIYSRLDIDPVRSSMENAVALIEANKEG